jgi:predicted permease
MRVVMHRMPSQAADAGLFVLAFNWRVFACIAAALACTVGVAGLVPALRLTRDVLSDHLKGSAGTTTGRAHRSNGFVIAQVALSMTLVMGAGLLVKAASRINDYQFGYDAAHLLGTWVHLGPEPHNAGGSAQLGDLIARIAHTDNVVSAASLAYAAPAGRVAESAVADGGNRRMLLHQYSIVSPDFLRTLGVPVIAGRDFAPGDAVSGAGAVIVDEAGARRLWPGGGAVGGQIRLGEDGNHLAWLPVVGIARQASLGFEADPDLRPEPVIYTVLPADGSRFHRIAIRVAGKTDPGSAARVALAVHRAMDAAAPGAGGIVSPWREDFGEMVAGRRFVAAVFSLVAAMAVGLAAVGLYGVLAYTVSQRTREFGIRLALGASRRSVFGLVLRDGAVMVLAGIGVGAIFAMWVAKLLSVWLYTVHPTDAGTLIGAEGVLLVVSVCACLVPALRATRAEPGDVLRAA